MCTEDSDVNKATSHKDKAKAIPWQG